MTKISEPQPVYANPHNDGEIDWDDELGLYIRKSTTDRKVNLQMYQYDQLPITKGDIVLDAGANIGGFGMYALFNGADKVISFEPEPGNFDMLTRNHSWFKGQQVGHPEIPSKLGGKEWEIYERALVGPGAPKEMALSINKGPNQGCHSIAPILFENGTSVLVKTAKFATIVGHYKPNLVKVDIEGAEYDTILFGGEQGAEAGKFKPYVWPDHIRAVALEFHLHHRSVWREQWAPALMEEFEIQGFGTLVEPIIKPNNWFTLGIYVR